MERDDLVPNPRIGAYYIAGAALTALPVVLGWPWAALLLWPAFSLAVVASGYFGAGPAIYRKRNGLLPLGTRILLAPTLFGQYLSLRHYQRQCRPWDEAVPGVLMGRRLNDREAAELVAAGVTAVLDLTAEFSEAGPMRGLVYRNMPILDLTAPTAAQLREAVTFISDQASRGVVYVHCKIGYSRTAAVVGAYLLAGGRCRTIEDAVSLMRAARPSIVIRPEAIAALESFRDRAF